MEAAAATSDAAHPDYLVRLHFVGSFVTLDGRGEPVLHPNAHFFVYANGQPPSTVRDTVPDDAVLEGVRWRGSAGAHSDTLQVVDDAPNYGYGPGRNPDGTLTVGVHILRLEVPARLGGGYAVVLVQVGFVPEPMWWAGPDPAGFPRASDGDGRAVDVLSWAAFRTSPSWPPDGRRYFGPDSFAFRPLDRKPLPGGLRTFYEIFGDRIYARAENDTVHFGAWLVFTSGGFDRDSRYVPMVVAGSPGLPPFPPSPPDLYRLLIPTSEPAGSPVGFRLRVQVRTEQGVTQPSESTTYPVFDPASVFHYPRVQGYWSADLSGKAYASTFPVDAKGLVSRGAYDVVDLADRVDAGGGTPVERELRKRVLTFYVRGSTRVAW